MDNSFNFGTGNGTGNVSCDVAGQQRENTSAITQPAAGEAAPFRGQSRPAKEPRTFSAKEKAMAWLAVLLGYLFCRTFWVWQKPAIGLIFTFCLFGFGLVFLGIQNRKPRSWFYLVSALVLSTALFFSASPVLLFFVFGYVCLAFLMFCQTGSETALENRAGQLYVFETVKAVFVSPFKSFGASFNAIGTDNGGKKLGKTLLIILAGLGIAIIPTIIVLRLLSFDGNFTGILGRISTTLFDKIFSHVWSLLFGLPIGMYVYGALYTSAHPRPDSFNAETCTDAENKMKFAPALVGAVAIAPLLFLYFVFIAAQWDYYRAIFESSLPAAYTFAEFARNGFFRLCLVAAINVVVLVALRVFSRKTKSGRISPVVKVYTVILSLVTVIISCTAISQMIMYVSQYGLTRLRLYTLWFMAVLVLLFLVIILKQLIEKLPFAAAALTVFVVCFGLLAVPDTDAYIARHNYDCYLSGRTQELDTEYLGKLSPSSVPVLCEIVKNGAVPGDVRSSALFELGRYAAEAGRPQNLPELLAERAYDGLDNDTRLKAARSYDNLYPRNYKSCQTQYLGSDGTYYDLYVSAYAEQERAVITDNPSYVVLSSRQMIDEAKRRLDNYAAACASAGKDNIVPFSSVDLGDAGRFYIAPRGGVATEDRLDAHVLYLYDTASGKLVVLYMF